MKGRVLQGCCCRGVVAGVLLQGRARTRCSRAASEDMRRSTWGVGQKVMCMTSRKQNEVGKVGVLFRELKDEIRA